MCRTTVSSVVAVICATRSKITGSETVSGKNKKVKIIKKSKRTIEQVKGYEWQKDARWKINSQEEFKHAGSNNTYIQHLTSKINGIMSNKLNMNRDIPPIIFWC